MVNRVNELNNFPTLHNAFQRGTSMKRRSVLRWLGLAPVAGPVAVAAASAPALSPIDHSALAADVRGRLTSVGLDLDGQTLSVPSLWIVPAPLDAANWMEARPAVVPDGRAWEAGRPV